MAISCVAWNPATAGSATGMTIKVQVKKDLLVVGIADLCDQDCQSATKSQ
jgi:hypothetical protein